MKALFQFLIISGMAVFIAVSCDNSLIDTGDGSLDTDKAFDGYTLFNPNGMRNTYLIDMDGQVVHQWNNSRSGGYSVYLLENGNILRSAQASNSYFQGGGSAGIIQEIDWDGNLVWEYAYSSSSYLAHHDFERLPNGNVLLIAWEVKSSIAALQAGRQNASTMWPEHIVEVEPNGSSGGTIVWEWHVWDHLIQDADASKSNYGVVADHPELIDINLGTSGFGSGSSEDWMHINGIDYNEELDYIVLSSHYFDEIYVIDHSTTTAEAAGHTGGNSGKGGDILYRWGNPSNYNTSGDQEFDVVHCAIWIEDGLPGAGSIMVFNNGEGQRASSVVELIPDFDSWSSGTAFSPSQPVWTYSSGSSFYSNHLGSNQRLPNGNTLISESTSGYLFEVADTGEKVWEYQYSSAIARSLRYAPDYSGLAQLE